MPRGRDLDRRRRAILFDLDGVLWSSVSAHRLAFQRALRDRGFPWRLSRKDFAELAGMTTEAAFKRLLGSKKTPGSRHEIAVLSRRKRIWARRYLAQEAPLAPALGSTLRRLHRSFRLGLVSSSHPQTAGLFLKRSGTRALFDVILTKREVPFSKPSPRIYRAALRRLRLKARDAYAVEDTAAGAQSAAGCGIPVIGMRGTESARRLRRAGAFRIISRLSELKNHAFDI